MNGVNNEPYYVITIIIIVIIIIQGEIVSQELKCKIIRLYLTFNILIASKWRAVQNPFGLLLNVIKVHDEYIHTC